MHTYVCTFITHVDYSRGSKAFSGVCVSLYLSVCSHDKTKTAELQPPNLPQG